MLLGPRGNMRRGWRTGTSRRLTFSCSWSMRNSDERGCRNRRLMRPSPCRPLRRPPVGAAPLASSFLPGNGPALRRGFVAGWGGGTGPAGFGTPPLCRGGGRLALGASPRPRAAPVPRVVCPSFAPSRSAVGWLGRVFLDGGPGGAYAGGWEPEADEGAFSTRGAPYDSAVEGT